jgi:hypothetical protein
MQTAPISGLQSTQQMQATSGDFWLQIMKATKTDPNGPFGKWVASHEAVGTDIRAIATAVGTDIQVIATAVAGIATAGVVDNQVGGYA